jgi:oligopeptidase B
VTSLRLPTVALLAVSLLPSAARPAEPPAAPTAPAAPVAPVAPRKDHVQTWHGRPVTDPWYWLREKENPEVRTYLEAENAYTAAVTAPIDGFSKALYAEMIGRVKQTDLSVPLRRGAFCYYARTVEGLQYPIRARRPVEKDRSCGETGKEEILLDLNEMAKGKPFIALGAFRVSDDGKRLLYSTDETGFRQFDLFVKDLATGKVSGPLAKRVTGAEWAVDGQTILYATEDEVTKRADTVWRLSPEGKTFKVYEEKDPLFHLALGRTQDLRYVGIVSRSTDTWETRLVDARLPDGFPRVVVPRQKGLKYEVEHRESVLFIRSNDGAKDFRVVTVPAKNPALRNWATFLDPRPGEKILDVLPFQDFLVVATQEAGLPRFRTYDFRKRAWSEITFPDPVYTATAVPGQEFASGTFRFRYQSPTTPPSVFDVDLATGARKLLKQDEVLGGYDPTRYASARLWAPARDGKRIPVSIVHRKDVAKDGRAPLWLYGYGSYGYGMPASFNLPMISALDRGVVFAIAHVRGGDEMGEAWHDDGMLMRKKNTFNDFVDVAEHLVKERWTSPSRLVAEGGSAGGLLMGAVANDRPDLFRAIHAAVPFVDVMNTMMDASLPLTTLEYLEWGDPNQKPAFEYMLSYSPYDNLAAKAYPAILVTTSFNDSQVMYWEPAKYVAKLRTLKTDSNPLLLKVKLEAAGHGGASGRYDALRDRAFQMAWMLSQVGITQ